MPAVDSPSAAGSGARPQRAGRRLARLKLLLADPRATARPAAAGDEFDGLAPQEEAAGVGAGAPGVRRAEEYDGLAAVAGLGAGDSSLHVGVLPAALAALPPAEAAARLAAELHGGFVTLDQNPPAALVVSVGTDGAFPLYRYPAAPLRRVVAAQRDWAAAPLVAAVRAAVDAVSGQPSNSCVVNLFAGGLRRGHFVIIAPHSCL